jgi:hypothetical protein
MENAGAPDADIISNAPEADIMISARAGHTLRRVQYRVFGGDLFGGLLRHFIRLWQ